MLSFNFGRNQFTLPGGSEGINGQVGGEKEVVIFKVGMGIGFEGIWGRKWGGNKGGQGRNIKVF